MKIFWRLIALSLLFANTAYGQGMPDVNYIPVERAQSGITVSKMDDFIRMIADYKIKDILVSKTTFAFQKDSAFYVITSEGYKTIKDYQDGHEKKFNDSVSFYYAQENSLKTQEEVDKHRADIQREAERQQREQAEEQAYFNSEYFLSEDDYKDALKKGFVKNTAREKSKINRISGLLSSEGMKNNARYINLILYADSYGRTDRNRVSDIGSEINSRQLTSGYYQINVQLKNGVRSDAVFYYISKICGYDSLNEYLTAIGALPEKAYERTLIIKGTEQIYKNLHFKSLEEMLDANNKGIRNGDDLILIQRYRLSTEYSNRDRSLESNREIIGEIDKFYTKFLDEKVKGSFIDPLRDAYILWFLKNKQKKPAYLDYVARRIYRYTQDTPQARIFSDLVTFKSQSFEDTIRFLLKNYPKTAEIINFDEETGMISGK
jgi:hypothetical protein